MRNVNLYWIVAIICCVAGLIVVTHSAEGSPVQSDSLSIKGPVTLRVGAWSDFSGTTGEIQLSFPISVVVPSIGDTEATGVAGITGRMGEGPDRALPLAVDDFQVQASSGPFKVAFGRGNVRWGTGKYATLILDSRVPSYPFVQLNVATDTRFGKTEYSRLIGKLDPYPDIYLLGHRLDLYPWPWLRLGVSEIAIADARFASIPTNWIPLWPFYLTQHLAIHSGVPGINEDSNENLGLDMTAILRPGTVLYGEFFVDDMPQRPENPGVYQVAFLVGGTTVLKQDLKLDAEYARVNNYTYTFRNPARSYLNQGKLLGFQLGPDTDRFIVMLRRQFEKVEVGAGVELRRRGEGRIGDKWQDIGWEEARKHAFLHGVVEKTSLFRAEATWEIAPGNQFQSGVAVGRVDNKDNALGMTGARLEWNAGLTWIID